ncbi:MAG: class I adenylate-forming enzyme family protein [Nitrospinaceae bacterium]
MAREFYNYLKTHAREKPGHPAVIDQDQPLTYQQLVDRVERFAGALSGWDLGPESKLGLFCLNQKEYLIAYLGALLKGVPVVPFNFLLGPEDLVFIAKNAGIDSMLVDPVFLKPETVPFFRGFKNRLLVDPANGSELGPGALGFDEFLRRGDPRQGMIPHERNPSIPDVILYTSGTTARPKGVMLDEKQFDINCDGILAHLDLNGNDRAIVALPLFHSFGNIMALILLRVGGTLILLRQFAPKTILSSVARHRATALPLVPTIYTFLIEIFARGGYDVSTLRCCISGGASLPQSLLKRVEETLDVTVIEGYGLTETSPVISVNRTAVGSVPGSVGPVLPNVEVKIVGEQGDPLPPGQVGEIWVKGETVMRGYWKNPEETRKILAPGGWLKTGDLGHMDEKNRLYISAGRKKDLIIRAGENVSPLTVENTLMNHPAVAEVAAVGVPDARLGEKVLVCVVLREGARVKDHELREFCRGNVPAFMLPDRIHFLESLPKNAAGKILKKQLRDLAGI